MKKLPTPVLLIAIGALLTPLLGGQISVDRMSIPGGITAFFQSVLGGLETPMLSHSLLALVFAAAVIAALKSRMIVQAPKAMFSGAMAAFVALLLLSIGFSQFRYASLAAATEWLSYAVALFGTVACVGRGRGPLLVLQALVTGVAVLAVLGLKDWAVQVKADPGYRLTGGWINPNAFAGMMAIGLVLAVALPASKERLGVALRWLAVFLCTTALMLTGSRAGLYASLAGILVWSALELVWRTGPKRVAVAALVVGLGVSAGIGLPKAVARGPGASAAASARALGGGTTDDSAQFRRNLFVGAMQLIKEQPLGRGVGTYRYYSAKPGLTTQTQLAHNNVLQTGVESGVLAVGCLVVAWFVWAGYVLRKASGIPAEQNMLRAGVFAAVATVVAQGMLESNLSYFGIGLAFHLLLGLGILVAPDAIGPEYLTKTARWSVGVTAAVISMVMGYMGIGQYFRARAYGEIEAGSPEEARNQAQLALSLVPVDAEAAGILATTMPGSEALKLAQRAVDLGPNTVALRWMSPRSEPPCDCGVRTPGTSSPRGARWICTPRCSAPAPPLRRCSDKPRSC